MNEINLELLNQINNGFHTVQAIDIATIILLIILIVAVVLAAILVPNAYDPRSAADIKGTQQELDVPITVIYGRVKIRSATRISILERVYEPVTAGSKK